jgi:sulfite reductase (NADPH) hemoprotein beta-component
MYSYSDFDEDFVRARVDQFASQVARRLDGSLTEEEFRPLRLMNGLYLQLHAYMLRVAIPYGTLSPRQMRQLAMIADTYDKGYGHFTTRQNIQYNWPVLGQVPAILGALADVEMHAIQTSGNCVRNVTADHFAGAARMRSTIHALTQNCCANGRWITPSFNFCPANSKLRSRAVRMTAP